LKKLSGIEFDLLEFPCKLEIKDEKNIHGPHFLYATYV